MRVLIDMDDVLELLSEHWVEVLNERFGTSCTREDMHQWDVEKTFTGHSREEVYSPLSEPGFWKGVKPMPGAVEAVQQLLSEGIEVYVVTTSYYKMLEEKMEDVLFKYFPCLKWGNVVVTSNKSLINGDILIDDGIHNLRSGAFIKVLFDAPWNREFDAEANGMIRVHNWDEAMDVIHSVKNNSHRAIGVKMRKGVV